MWRRGPFRKVFLLKTSDSPQRLELRIRSLQTTYIGGHIAEHGPLKLPSCCENCLQQCQWKQYMLRHSQASMIGAWQEAKISRSQAQIDFGGVDVRLDNLQGDWVPSVVSLLRCQIHGKIESCIVTIVSQNGVSCKLASVPLDLLRCCLLKVSRFLHEQEELGEGPSAQPLQMVDASFVLTKSSQSSSSCNLGVCCRISRSSEDDSLGSGWHHNSGVICSWSGLDQSVSSAE